MHTIGLIVVVILGKEIAGYGKQSGSGNSNSDIHIIVYPDNKSRSLKSGKQ